MSVQSAADLKRVLDHYQELYNNTGENGISDEEFDAMVRYYEDISGIEYKPIGAKTREEAVRLPSFSPSLDKIKDKDSERALNSFLERYDADLLNLDKYDGISMFAHYVDGRLHLYKRGDGEFGPDVSILQNYLQFPQLPFNCLIRGELVMFESEFEELKPYLVDNGQKAINSRTVVNGCTNRTDPDSKVISKCTFIPYAIYSLDMNETYGFTGEKILMETQLNMLKSWGFYVPEYTKLNKSECTVQKLREYLKQRREQAPYRIDGTVLIFNIDIGAPTENKNPDYAVAVKEDLIRFTTILDCTWNLTSKDGYMTPVIQVEPVFIVTNVSEITLHNARMVLENKLGRGDYIAVTQGGDIIPKFLWVVNSLNYTENRNYDGTINRIPKIIFSPIIPYQWNKNGVEIMVINPDSYPQVKCARMKYFLDVLGCKKFGLLTILKLYNSGITTLGKLIRVTVEQLMEADGIQERGARGLLNELQKGIANGNMSKFMAGSCIFGESIGRTIMEKFTKQITNWKYCDVTYEQILSLKDFGPARAKIISEKLPEFKQWLSGIPELENITIKQVSIKSHSLGGFIFYFTGFTDHMIKQEIESYSGVVSENYTKSCNVVIRKDSSYSSVKTIDAINSNGKIKLLTRKELMDELTKLRTSNL